MWAGSLPGSLSALKFCDCRIAGQEIHQDQVQRDGGSKSVPLGQPSQSLHTFLLIFSSIDCLYTNTNYLEVNFRVEVLKPGKTLEIPITFYPRECINYRELITFEINGLSQHVVEIKGRGAEMKVRGDPRTGTLHPVLPSPLAHLSPRPSSPLHVSGL